MPRCSYRASAIAPPARGASPIWFFGPVLLVLFLFSVHRFWAWHFGDDVSLGIELVVSAAAMVAALDRGRGLQQSLVAAVDLDRRGRGRPRRAPGDSGGHIISSTRLAAARPAGIRGRRSSHVAGAALPADHGLHRPREPRHVRRRPRVVGARRRLDPDPRTVVAGRERGGDPRPAGARRRTRRARLLARRRTRGTGPLHAADRAVRPTG